MDNKFVGKTFKDQEIVIDDKIYISCKFVNCKIIYTGGDHTLMNVKFDNCQITLAGEANKTVQFMQTVGMIPPLQGLVAPPASPAIPDSGITH